MAKRAKPPLAVARQLLETFSYGCAYCQLPIGSVVRKHGQDHVTELNWDHFTPFAYSENNPLGNWLPACDLCNGIKASHHYDSIENAQYDILDAWTRKGYKIEWIPPVSSEQDPRAWASAFATWIS